MDFSFGQLLNCDLSIRALRSHPIPGQCDAMWCCREVNNDRNWKISYRPRRFPSSSCSRDCLLGNNWGIYSHHKKFIGL